MKKIILFLICIIFVPQIAFAEKIPVKITPIQEISTFNDAVEVGDWIKFKVVNDVYYGNNLYIKKDTIVTGIVENLHENGLIADNAEIYFQEFKLRTVDGKLITIKYPLYLNRSNSVCYNFLDKAKKYVGVIFKGNEVYIKPYTTTYNLILNK